MSEDESPSARYRRLAGECLGGAEGFALGEQRDTLLQMAQIWQRLAGQYADSTAPFRPIGAKQPAMQQQQQIQPDEGKKG